MAVITSILALAGFGLAGCGSSPAGPAALALRPTTYGSVVTDSAGRSLYIYLPDHTDPPLSTCLGGCADDWPPAVTTTAATPVGGITAVGEVARPDGAEQLTVGGYPLYYFSGDRVAGDTRGEGVGGVWYLLTPSGNPLPFSGPVFDVAGPTIPTTLGTIRTPAGPVVTDAAGQTAYVYRRDAAGSSTCTQGWCVQDWPPLLTTAAPTAPAGVTGSLGTVRRPDGTSQVTLDGHPLYTFSGDLAPGEVRGEGVGGSWFAAGGGGAGVGGLPAAVPVAGVARTVLPPALPPLSGLVPGPGAASYVAFNLEGDVDDYAAPGGCWEPVATRGPAAGSYRHDLYFPAATPCDTGRWAIDVEFYDSPGQLEAAPTGGGGTLYRYYELQVVVDPTAPAPLAAAIAALPLRRVGA